MFLSRRDSFLFAHSAKTLLFTVCLAMVLRALVVSSYVIQTDAMSPTLSAGEFVLAWKGMTPRRGDVVILSCPDSESGTCIKRVVGVPGDRVEIEKQRLIINEKPAEYDQIPSSGGLRLQEKLAGLSWSISLDPDTPASMPAVVVPPDHVFVLNDRRSDGADSRKWGPIAVGQLEARVWRIWMSMNWAKNRPNWDRLFQRIH